VSRRTVYFPHNVLLFAVLLVILVLVAGLILLGTSAAFRDVGFSPAMTALILVATFVGGFINIPVLKLRNTVPVIKEEFVSFFGVVYRIPRMEHGETTTLVAVNAGGALIPSFVSVYLLWKQPSVTLYAIVGIVVVALVTHLIARPLKGVGITAPFLVSPIVAAISAYVLFPSAPRIIAYVAGVLGTLIGADLTNLHVVPKLGAPVVSIGGAGTFDGVFLSGILAALLA